MRDALRLTQNELERIREYERLCNERTLSLLAFDLKIRPDGTVCVVEVNGSDFGWKGFKKANPNHPIEENLIDYLTSFGLPVSIITTEFNDTSEHLAELSNGKIDVRKVDSRRKDVYAHLGLEERLLHGEVGFGVQRSGGESYRTDDVPTRIYAFERIIWNKSYRKLSFDESRYLVANPHIVNSVTRDKDLTKKLFDGAEQYVPYGIQVIRGTSHYDDLAQFVARAKSKRVIIKPKDSSGGEGIRIIEKDALLVNGRPIPDVYTISDGNGPIIDTKRNVILVEEFVESMPIRSDVTGKLHDGCMRYVVAVESNRGFIKATHLGGYWRLCPEALSAKGSTLERQLKANLSDGALPQQASAEHIDIVQKQLDQILPTLYRRFLTASLSVKATETPLFITDGSKFNSDTHYLSKTERSAAFKEQRKHTLHCYSLEELASVALPILRQIENTEGLQRAEASDIRRELMDRKAQIQYNGALQLLDIRDLDIEHITSMRYQEAYATASHITLPRRAHIKDGALQERLVEYAQGVAHIYYYNTTYLTKETIGDLEKYCRAIHELGSSEQTPSRETLLRHVLDFKTMVTEQQLATAQEMTFTHIERLNQLQLYELAIQYGIGERSQLGTSGLDKQKLVAALKPFVAAKPKISVFVDGYQSQETLEECLTSLLTQDVKGGIEVCVVVDGTDQNLKQKLVALQRKYRSPQKVLRIKYTFTDNGHAAAYTKCLAMCRGDYIVTAHGSDRVHKWRDQDKTDSTHLASLCKYLERENIGIVHARHDYIDHKGTFVGREEYNTQKEDGCVRPFLAFRRELYEALVASSLGSFKPSTLYHPDPELGLKLNVLCQYRGLQTQHIEKTFYDARLGEHETVDTSSARQRRESKEAEILYRSLLLKFKIKS